MPRSDEPAKIKAEYDQIFKTLYEVDDGIRALQLAAPFTRAIDIALFNGFAPVRWVISRRLSRRMGAGVIKTIAGLPVQVDEDTEEGFGLIVSR